MYNTFHEFTHDGCFEIVREPAERKPEGTYNNNRHILTAKDILIRQLNMMKDNPYPGFEEEKLLDQRKEVVEEEEGAGRSGGRRVHNAYVSTPRLQSSVRSEIILASIEFLAQRLDED